MVLGALAIEGKGVAWIPGSLANAELGDNGKLAVAGLGQLIVPLHIVLVRQRAGMSELAEQFRKHVDVSKDYRGRLL